MLVSGGMTNVDYNKWWDAIPPYPPTLTIVYTDLGHFLSHD